MKRILIFLMAIIPLALTSCSSDDTENENEKEQHAIEQELQKYVGTWKQISQWEDYLETSKDIDEYLLTIRKDGTYKISGVGKWSDNKEGKLMIFTGKSNGAYLVSIYMYINGCECKASILEDGKLKFKHTAMGSGMAFTFVKQ
jgi:hypothetical protein